MFEELPVNGVNGATGDYIAPALTDDMVAKLALSDRPDPPEQALVRRRAHQPRGDADPSFGGLDFLEDEILEPAGDRVSTRGGIAPKSFEESDLTDLAEAGWGVIFADDAPPSVREALKPLLDHRRTQATSIADLFRDFSGPAGHRQRESAAKFLTRQNVDPGLAPNPSQVPYYLLVVGDPQRIPYRFQYLLDVDRAVGRLHFDTDEEYARYAESVVAAEAAEASAPRTMTLFGPKHADDSATRLSADLLVKPLADLLQQRFPAWTVNRVLEGEATKARLSNVIGHDQRSTFLFTAGHGVAFDNEHPDQIRHQGALLCQDWPGPGFGKKPLPHDFFYSVDDLPDSADVGGMVMFCFACFGLGTPRLDDFPGLEGESKVIAPQPFVAKLPQRLLAHPRGGALAVIGHIDRAFPSTFRFAELEANVDPFARTVAALLQSRPVGNALEPLNDRHARMTNALVNEREAIEAGRAQPNTRLLAQLFLARNDARNYAVFGDPAVRLRVEN